MINAVCMLTQCNGLAKEKWHWKWLSKPIPPESITRKHLPRTHAVNGQQIDE